MLLFTYTIKLYYYSLASIFTCFKHTGSSVPLYQFILIAGILCIPNFWIPGYFSLFNILLSFRARMGSKRTIEDQIQCEYTGVAKFNAISWSICCNICIKINNCLWIQTFESQIEDVESFITIVCCNSLVLILTAIHNNSIYNTEHKQPETWNQPKKILENKDTFLILSMVNRVTIVSTHFSAVSPVHLFIITQYGNDLLHNPLFPL